MDEQSKASGKQPEHPGWLGAYRVPRTNFDAALHALAEIPFKVSRDGRHAKMVAALDGGATIEQIRHWRAGRRHPPQWVFDLLDKKLASRELSAATGRSFLKCAS